LLSTVNALVVEGRGSDVGAARAVGLVLGMVADTVVGDPRRGHPVAAFGQVASAAERVLYTDDRLAGAVHTGLLVGGTAALGIGVERFGRDHQLLRIASTAAATWIVLGGTSLATEGAAMARSLDSGDIDAARQRLPSLCGRDPSRLDLRGLARAGVESVAENTADAVVAPLVWGALAGIPGLLTHRAVNTLDAMVGHRTARYRHFGWAAARLDDLANLLPSRVAAALTVVCAPVVGGSAGSAWLAWRRDAAAHPSPNAGQVEAAFAGALQIRLGGRTVYPHGAEERPVLGDGRAPDAGDLTRGVELSRVVGAAMAALAVTVALFRRR